MLEVKVGDEVVEYLLCVIFGLDLIVFGEI